MGLQVHRAERADVLVRALAELLSGVPSDPFQPDVVAVPSRGVERWIAQSLSTSLGAQPEDSDGVCANVHFPPPGRLVREALTATTGIAADDDPWAERRLPWPLLDVIDDCAGEEWCRTLGRHLGLVEGGVNQGRRMAVAQKLAGLFTAYAAERPPMLQAWRRRDDTDGYGQPLDRDLAWQAELWRRLREHLGTESPAERLGPVCQRLREQPQLVDLPERVSIFGPTRLATDQLAVIAALAEHRDVHLWLPHPSNGLWRQLQQAVGGDVAVSTRRADPTREVPEHPLLRSLGRDAREMQVRLAAHTAMAVDEHLEPPTTPKTLLGTVQADLHADRPPDPGSHTLSDTDGSVQVHACHGRHRQVEVLREVLLGLLADDPTLELRDIIVMCPDIEAYAPLISASLGVETLDDADGAAGHAHPGHHLTFRLADRSLRQTNPVLGVAGRLLDLADARLTASEVLDLAAMQPVRRRFGFDEEALDRIGEWVRRAGVRWGLDAHARDAYGLRGIGQNTWEHGLDRILAGVAMDEEGLRPLGAALPLDDIDSTEIELVGRLAELLDRLDAAVGELTREQPLDRWMAALTGALAAFVDVAPRDAWQLSQARTILADVAATAANGSGTPLLGLSDARALLGDRLAGRPTRANFRTGHLTVATMVPMRSVPHRVVCLLGLDDGVFPRGTRVDGDDVLSRIPRVGERDRRSEDRQLFLDAILAAQQRLVVLYTGADERNGAERPPAVPLGELLDVLDRSATVSAGRVRDRVVVAHPLQPFDARNFIPGRLGRPQAFSFDTASYDGSLALREGQTARRPFLEAPLPAAPVDTVSLESLIRFLEHPVRGFLRERLELRTADEQEQPSDAVPVDPDGLELWAVGDRLLRAGLAGLSRDAACHVERLRGGLPPGGLGATELEAVVDNVTALLERSRELRSKAAETVDVRLDLPSGMRVDGTVPRVYGNRVVRIEYSKLSAKHRIRAWVQLLALCAQLPGRNWTAVTIGRGARGTAVSTLTGMLAADARGHLAALVDLYRAGLTRPLPVPPRTACAYAQRRGSGVNPDTAATLAAKEWRQDGQSSAWGEYDDADHERVGLRGFADLLAAAPDPAASFADEPHLFGQLARRIWSPLQAAEVVE